MPKYRVETDQGTFEVESDKEPTEADIRAYLKASAEAPKAEVAAPAASPSPAGRKWGPSDFGDATDPAYDGNSEIGKSIALNAGGAAGGAAIGTALFPGVGTIVGGLIGSTFGNLADQATRPGQKGIKLGELGASAALGAIPGAGAAAQGGKAIAKEALKQGAIGLAAKTGETLIDEGRLPSAGEAALSTLLPAAGGAVAQKIQGSSPATAKAIAAAQEKTSVKRVTLQEAQKIGLVAPPSMVNPGKRPGMVETIAEVGPTRQQASVMNQEATDAAVRREIGLSDTAPINESSLEEVRKEAGKAYANIAALGDESNMPLIVQISKTDEKLAEDILKAPQILEDLKQARADAKGYYRLADRSADPKDLRLAREYEKTADELEARIEEIAKASGREDLYKEFQAARKLIAKTYTVERAMNLGDGTVSARDLGKALDRGVPLDGELQTVAKFALAFPKVVQDSGHAVPTSGIRNAGLGAIAGGLIGTTTHNPAMTVAATIAPAMASAAARKALLSKPYQQTFSKVLDQRIKADPQLLELLLRESSQSVGLHADPVGP